MDCSPPGSSVHGILQARILEWVTIPFSRGIFSTQGLNVGLLHCRWILYRLSQGWSLNLRILRGGKSIPKHIGLGPTLRSYLWLLRASQVALVVKNPPANAGDTRDGCSIPGLGRSPGEGHGNPLQCSCLENPMDSEAWQATVHGVARVGYDLVTKPPPYI